jgi:hypothetical protein
MSGPSDFNTWQRIIKEAMYNAGYLAKNQLPTSADYARYANRLNDLINVKQTQGLKLWLQLDFSVPLVAGQTSYVLGPGSGLIASKPTRILDDGYYLDNNNISRPLFIISQQEWDQLSTRTQQGAVTQFFPKKNAFDITVNFWLTPDAVAATGQAHLIIQQQQPQLVQLNDTMYFPQEWFIALHWGLADEISTGQPQAIMDRCEKRSAMYWTMLEDFDVEDASTRFQPDYRGQIVNSSFR